MILYVLETSAAIMDFFGSKLLASKYKDIVIPSLQLLDSDFCAMYHLKPRATRRSTQKSELQRAALSCTYFVPHAIPHANKERINEIGSKESKIYHIISMGDFSHTHGVFGYFIFLTIYPNG